ncbi:MAG TPA: NlpC/P60 family protein [Rugosimonospora sp.]|nr:NlpC/P60 family protein [Rugosimonospora sp.]
MPEQSMRIRSTNRRTRRLTWSLVACTALCLLIPRPAGADPGNNTVPDTGAVPVATTPAQIPGSGTSTTPATPVAGPLGTQIMNETSAVEALGEQLKQAQITAVQAHDITVSADQTLQQAQSFAADMRERANNAAAEAYKKAEALGPFGQYANTMHELGVLAPGFGVGDSTPGGVAGSQSALQDAARADQVQQEAQTAYQAAQSTEQQADQLRDQLSAEYAKRATALTTLRDNNTQAVAQAEAAQEATDQQLAGQFAAGSNVDGQVANPIALKAVRFALSQLRKPYLWGAEGFDAYDCSGLTWRSYQQANFSIPRVAKDQYHGTTPIDVTKLLPGDLLFFSTVSKTDWTTISHVAMYLGDNKMVESPHTGAVVRVNTVWWSAFFGATRVVPAVAAPTPPPSPSPSPSPTPSRTPSHAPSAPPPPPSHEPSAPPPSSTKPSSAPTSAPPPSPSTSPSPSASAAASQSPARSSSVSPSVSTSAS